MEQSHEIQQAIETRSVNYESEEKSSAALGGDDRIGEVDDARDHVDPGPVAGHPGGGEGRPGVVEHLLAVAQPGNQVEHDDEADDHDPDDDDDEAGEHALGTRDGAPGAEDVLGALAAAVLALIIGIGTSSTPATGTRRSPCGAWGLARAPPGRSSSCRRPARRSG